jgi:hypothetical protein
MVVIRSGWMMNVPLCGAMVRFDHFGSGLRAGAHD